MVPNPAYDAFCSLRASRRRRVVWWPRIGRLIVPLGVGAVLFFAPVGGGAAQVLPMIAILFLVVGVAMWRRSSPMGDEPAVPPYLSQAFTPHSTHRMLARDLFMAGCGGRTILEGIWEERRHLWKAGAAAIVAAAAAWGFFLYSAIPGGGLTPQQGIMVGTMAFWGIARAIGEARDGSLRLLRTMERTRLSWLPAGARAALAARRMAGVLVVAVLCAVFALWLRDNFARTWLRGIFGTLPASAFDWRQDGPLWVAAGFGALAVWKLFPNPFRNWRRRRQLDAILAEADAAFEEYIAREVNGESE